jgi:signal transduction histidine kinase
MISEGSAFLDGSGRLLVADAEFRALLGLPPGDESGALRRRAGADPMLATLLAGEGPERVHLPALEGATACDLFRVKSDAGFLLRASAAAGGALAAPALEYAMQAIALVRLAGSVAHEVKNPLNAMALQLALLGDKIETNGPLASSCAGNLVSLKNQIGRINEVVRRYLDVADPTPSGAFDAGSLLADVANVFSHEARRRLISLACQAGPGTVRASGDPERAARLLLGLLWSAISGTPSGGRLLARVASTATEAVLSVEHTRGIPDPALGWVLEVVAAAAPAMRGRLEESSEGDTVRVALVLPKERPL